MTGMDLVPHYSYEHEAALSSSHHHQFNHQQQPHQYQQQQQQLLKFASNNHLNPSETPSFSPSALSHLYHPDATRGSLFAGPLPPPNVSGQPLSASSRPRQTPPPYQQTPFHISPYPSDAFHADSPQFNPYAPMAAPPLPNTPSSQQLAGSNAAPSPGTPQSPGSQTREQQRVALLLEINVELLQEVNRLQSDGKGGAITPQQQAQLKEQGQPDNLAADEYIQCLRRVQANLSYLSLRAQNNPSKLPQGPMYMTPPPHMPQLQPKYDSLKELFPGWHGANPRMIAQQQQLQQQQQQQQQAQQNIASPSATFMGGSSANGTPTQQ